MTLRTDPGALWTPEPPPASADPIVVAWAHRQFQALSSFLRRPEFPAVIFTRLNNTGAEEVVKLQDGILAYFDAGAVPGAPGLYLREGNTWRKL
jgi:hypothetical protein